jgi:Tfp pilus assembly protein PilF
MDLASSYLTNEHPRLALRQLQAVQHQADNNPDYHFLYGLISARLERRQEAALHLKTAVHLRPDFAQAWNNLGEVYASTGQKENARAAFAQALKIPTYLTPEYPAYNLAMLFAQQGQTNLAVQAARQSIQYNPGFISAVSLLNKLLTEENQLQEAEDVLKQGLRANPGNVRLMQDLAENLLRLGKQAQARQWFKRIVHTADPQSEAAHVAADYLELLPY